MAPMLFGVLAHVITRPGLAADRKVLAVSTFPEARIAADRLDTGFATAAGECTS
jgi:hypothetical protein